jgi:CRP/FNR family transcriptional regulator, cyclic AMP receptor protein
MYNMLNMANIQTDDTSNQLSEIQLLKGVTPEQLDWIVRHAHRRNFEAGRNVMTIEQPGEAVYIILHGSVKIHMEQGERDVILAILGAGDMLGEMSLIESVGRSASAVTLEHTSMLWMDKDTFNYMLDNFPPVARNLVKIMSKRVRYSDEMIQALATLDVNGRVARQLLAFSKKYGREKDGVTQIRITLTQGDIADLVGASRKRVNQAMVLFKEQGLIDDADGRISIKNNEGLARYCR